MKYPVILYQDNNKIIAFCPLMHNSFAEGISVEDAIGQLREKFLCYIHDKDIQIEIIPLSNRLVQCTRME